MKNLYPDLKYCALIGSVRDRARLEYIAKPTFSDRETFERELANLREVILNSNAEVKDVIKRLVPNYQGNHDIEINAK